MSRRTALVGVMLLLLPQMAAAQSLSFSSKNSDLPITVTSQAELSLSFGNEKQATARGKATATQGDTQVVADELVVHYRDKPGRQKIADGSQSPESGNEVYRVDAVGNVTITTKGETATGRAAVYDFDRKVVVLEGDPVTLVSTDGTVTAHRTLQYWIEEEVAVAEGNAVAVDSTAGGAGRRIRADKLTAFFRDTPADSKKKTASKAGRDLIFLQGEGNVALTTKAETVRGDRADYNFETSDVIVEGRVKLDKDGITADCPGYVSGNVKIRVTCYTNAARAKGGPATPPGRARALITPKSATETPPKPAEASR